MSTSKTTKAARTPKKGTEGQSKRGRPMNLYIHPEDEHQIRRLAGWLAMQGYRVSDSQVVKAALRCAGTDKDLLKAYQSTIASDGRYKQSKEN